MIVTVRVLKKAPAFLRLHTAITRVERIRRGGNVFFFVGKAILNGEFAALDSGKMSV